MRLVIDCELNYWVYILCDLYSEGKLSNCSEIETLEVLELMSNTQLSICLGIENYSSYNVFCKDIISLSIPRDSVRHSSFLMYPTENLM